MAPHRQKFRNHRSSYHCRNPNSWLGKMNFIAACGRAAFCVDGMAGPGQAPAGPAPAGEAQDTMVDGLPQIM